MVGLTGTRKGEEAQNREEGRRGETIKLKEDEMKEEREEKEMGEKKKNTRIEVKRR